MIISCVLAVVVGLLLLLFLIVDNLLFLRISITFLQFALVTSLLIDKDDQTENNDLSADAQERPQGGEFAYETNKRIFQLIFASFIYNIDREREGDSPLTRTVVES